MAQVEQSSGDGKKKKGAQKKMSIHVDFTPMVDMNMLLITFFMLCTTMIKSQTLSIALPTNEKLEQTELQKAKESEAITLILDTEYDDNGNVKGNTVYYYTGKPEMELEGEKVVSSNLAGYPQNPSRPQPWRVGRCGEEKAGVARQENHRGAVSGSCQENP